jgi:hypothetical protein
VADDVVGSAEDRNGDENSLGEDDFVRACAFKCLEDGSVIDFLLSEPRSQIHFLFAHVDYFELCLCRKDSLVSRAERKYKEQYLRDDGG